MRYFLETKGNFNAVWVGTNEAPWFLTKHDFNIASVILIDLLSAKG